MNITPAFMSRTATAKRLGIPHDTFKRLIANMRRAGFPEVDPVMGRYVTADVEAWRRGGVEAWIESRRQIRTGAPNVDNSGPINYRAL